MWLSGLQVILGTIVGLTKPAYVTWLQTDLFTYALGFLMLSMGLTLTFADFKRCLRNPWTVSHACYQPAWSAEEECRMLLPVCPKKTLTHPLWTLPLTFPGCATCRSALASSRSTSLSPFWALSSLRCVAHHLQNGGVFRHPGDRVCRDRMREREGFNAHCPVSPIKNQHMERSMAEA